MALFSYGTLEMVYIKLFRRALTYIVIILYEAVIYREDSNTLIPRLPSVDNYF